MRFGDRVLRAFGLQRSADASRRGSRMVAFSGAASNRLTADWSPYVQSPDQETRHVLTTLRARARQLVKDNSHASGFLNELANNVIGPDGILLQAKVKTSAGTLAKKTNAEIERGWTEWGMPEHASADGFDAWTDLERLFIRTIAQDGEIFIRKHRYFDNDFGFALQIIDADLVDETLNRPGNPDAGVNEIRMGVEVNRFGRAVAYHVWNRHPGDGVQRERHRIGADEIIHRFVRYRPNQVRGVSWFAPVLVDMKMLDGYEEAELVAARIAASKMGWVVNKHPDAIAAFDAEKFGEPKQLDVEPGVISELLPGQEFQAFDPTNPSAAFKDFTKAILRGIARGLNMAYTTLTGDLEAVNYSSIRAGLLSERDQYRTLQRWLGVHIHRPVYREWLQMALLAGAVRVDSRLAADYYAVEWKPRGWKWVDPVNDLTAAALAIALGLTSRQRLAAEQGLDFEDVVEEIAHEIEVAEQLGVPITGAGQAPTTDAPAITPGRDYQSPDHGDAEDDEDEATRDRAAARRRASALRLALALAERAAA